MRRCRFAQYDETLWLDVLRHYTAKGDECATQIQELLELIEESRALPPLMVVEALARALRAVSWTAQHDSSEI